MKIVKWLVSLFNKLVNKQKPEQEPKVLPEKQKEMKTDPIVFVKGSPEVEVTVLQEGTLPEDFSDSPLTKVSVEQEESLPLLISPIKVEEVKTSKEFFQEDISYGVKTRGEHSVVNIKPKKMEQVEEQLVSLEKPIVEKTKKSKPKTETPVEPDKENKKKPTRRGKSKKKS